jgi:hypothetical protein
VPASRRLSQRISEGDGIAIIVHVGDADGARAAAQQGAKAVAVRGAIDGIREMTTLPVLWLGAGSPVDADAVAVRAADDASHEDVCETVAAVHDEEELELALDRLDPEIFLLSAPADDGEDAVDAVLELLPDVPAGKLAIADVAVTSRDEVLALERAGIDAVLVPAGNVAPLVGEPTPDV